MDRRFLLNVSSRLGVEDGQVQDSASSASRSSGSVVMVI
jgi:hypothetical protein